ncbi:MAG: pilus assembly protein PilZ [Peptococcaceae bacterium]|nr:pilus assembly protein PilZ [Peptococcaceae bacterium]
MLYGNRIYEGMPIELEVSEGEYQGKYRTKIEEIGNNIISIGVPLVEGHFIPLREGTKLKVIFTDESAAYAFSSTIVKRITSPIPTFFIEAPKKIRKIQRRQHVRVPVVQDLTYRIVDEEVDGKEDDGEEKKGFTQDLSGGGLLLKCSEELSPKTKIKIKMLIDTVQLEIPAVVIRSVKEDDNVYSVSVAFTDISERTRDKIIKYIFSIQREMLKKGLV